MRLFSIKTSGHIALWLAGFVSFLGCGSGSESTPKNQSPIELIPTSPDAIESCHEELGATYCSESDAIAAAQACSKRLPASVTETCETPQSCVVAYTPTRPGACVSGPTYSTTAQCKTPVEDNCALYRACLEPSFPCGIDGYALGFGEPLCYLFIDHRGEFSPAGQRWLQGVRTCLQRALAAEMTTRPASCDALADAAYASHTTCYTAPDNSFCDLSPDDVAALENLVLPYIDNPRVGAQIRAVLDICKQQKP